MDGQNRHRAIAGTLPHVFGASLFEDWIYWTDWNTHTVERAHKYTGEQRTVMGNNTHRPYDIRIHHPYRQPRSKLICTCFYFQCPCRLQQKFLVFFYDFVPQVRILALHITWPAAICVWSLLEVSKLPASVQITSLAWLWDLRSSVWQTAPAPSSAVATMKS